MTRNSSVPSKAFYRLLQRKLSPRRFDHSHLLYTTQSSHTGIFSIKNWPLTQRVLPQICIHHVRADHRARAADWVYYTSHNILRSSVKFNVRRVKKGFVKGIHLRLKCGFYVLMSNSRRSCDLAIL